MSQLTERLALAVFTVLSGALATNMFVLQPPARRGVTGPEDRIAAMHQEGRTTGAISQPSPIASAPPASQQQENTTQPSSQTSTPTEQNPLKVAPPTTTSATPDLIKAIQRELRAKGYETGAEDGTLSLVTRAAIMAYEADQKLPLTADPREDLLTQIILGEVGGGTHVSSATLTPAAQDVVREVQAELKRTGHDPGTNDGTLSEATIRAIRSFESAEHMPEKGRISGEIIAKLKSLPTKQASR